MPRRAPHKTDPDEQRFRAWLQQYRTPEMVRQARVLPLRRDMLTLLTFVRDKEVVGAQSTGNMPLKAVREVTARFVDPSQLDTTIGDRVYKLRTEADVWPLYFLHILAEVGGLLSIAPARRWRLTPQGSEFLGADPLLQLSFLLTTWWYEVNWLVAYPVAGLGDALPPAFQLFVLARLRSLPVGTRVDFETFADELIRQTGLTWTAQDTSVATMLLHGSIRKIVFNVLADFGAVEREYREEPLGHTTISRLAAFEITPLGEALLNAVAMVSG
jgi:hypothetical protein